MRFTTKGFFYYNNAMIVCGGIGDWQITEAMTIIKP